MSAPQNLRHFGTFTLMKDRGDTDNDNFYMFDEFLVHIQFCGAMGRTKKTLTNFSQILLQMFGFVAQIWKTTFNQPFDLSGWRKMLLDMLRLSSWEHVGSVLKAYVGLPDVWTAECLFYFP